MKVPKLLKKQLTIFQFTNIQVKIIDPKQQIHTHKMALNLKNIQKKTKVEGAITHSIHGKITITMINLVIYEN